MNAAHAIAHNNDLQSALNEANKTYYEDLLLYVRTNALFKNETKTEDVLLEILQDMLEAQQAGIDAVQYFGVNPKDTADEILKSIPNDMGAFLQFALSGVGGYLLFAALPSLQFPDIPIDLGKLFIVGLYSFFAILLSMWLLGRIVYAKSRTWRDISACVVIGGIVALGIYLFVSMTTPLQLNLSGTPGIIVILGVCLLIGTYFVRLDADMKRSMLPLMPLITSSAIMGIIVRILMFSDVLETDAGLIIGIGVMLGVLLIQYIWVFYYLRHTK